MRTVAKVLLWLIAVVFTLGVNSLIGNEQVSMSQGVAIVLTFINLALYGIAILFTFRKSGEVVQKSVHRMCVSS